MAESMRPRQARAWALVLATIKASTMMRAIDTSSSLSQVVVGTSMGVKGVACVMVVAKKLMHQDRGALPTFLWLLVDRCIPARALKGCVSAGIGLASSRQRALYLLCCHTLEQRANLMVGLTVLGCRGL